MTTRQETDSKGEERRKNQRFPFVAGAEVSEAGSRTKLRATVSEISAHGCYLDMLNPLPMETHVMVKIFAGADSFEASATVVYSHPNLGLGVVFQDASQASLGTLQKWLLEAMGTTDPASGKR